MVVQIHDCLNAKRNPLRHRRQKFIVENRLSTAVWQENSHDARRKRLQSEQAMPILKKIMPYNASDKSKPCRFATKITYVHLPIYGWLFLLSNDLTDHLLALNRPSRRRWPSWALIERTRELPMVEAARANLKWRCKRVHTLSQSRFISY